MIKSCEVCILAGGRSERMGRDKSRLRLGQRTMLGHVRAAARATGLPVRIIRRDSVPRCGPLGGILTALKSSRAKTVLFLACDMPCVTTELLQWIIAESGAGSATFIRTRRRAAFPLILSRTTLSGVTQQIQKGQFSLHALAKVLNAKFIRPSPGVGSQLRNVNTPTDWRKTRQLWRKELQ